MKLTGFKTPLGILAIGGLHVLPIWLFALQKDLFVTHLSFLPTWVSLTGKTLHTDGPLRKVLHNNLLYLGVIVLLLGRILCAMVETWCVKTHIKCLLIDDSNLTDKNSR